MLSHLRMKGLLSFRETDLALRSLNVLVGPNAAGKSNLIEAIALLRAVPEDLPTAFRRGGFSEWLWKGINPADSLTVETTLDAEQKPGSMGLRYRLTLDAQGPGFTISEETLENAHPYPGYDKPYLYFEVRQGKGRLNVLQKGRQVARKLHPDTLSPGQSVLRERRDPDQYPEVTAVAKALGAIRIYREWNTGRESALRRPQATDLPNVFLEEDGANLALVLNRMERDGSLERVERELNRFYPQFSRLSVQIEANTAQLFVKEAGLGRLVPATRLSDGTLRFLCLLAVLCHPTPPPILCLEEPEVGLHPDVLPQLAELLRAASERVQVIVTTHSDVLIDALTDTPESVVVCERGYDAETTCRRLDREELSEWLRDYRLGQLWRKGQLGGTRW